MARSPMHRLALVIATCGPLGSVPLAPGTAGSAAGLVLLWAVRTTGSAALEVAVVAAVATLGVWGAGVAERHFGRVDPGPVVIDEVLGQLVTLMLLPVNTTGVLAGFLVFRLLDIVKPWPARRMEAWPGGLGVMADDGMAAVYGNVIMRGLIAVAPGWLT
ncbi:MAG: phosphatidylglycerophosphatase A [Acidobacteria bacterium]|nr:phosphatidylglycerophosphatase A [Acidobacteriota bacterium]